VNESYADAINATKFVAKYNTNMQRVLDTLTTYGPGSMDEKETAALLDIIRKDVDEGFTIWESLSKRHPKLANGIHDLAYYIVASGNQVMIKSIVRERLSKDLLGL
jgi:hypothetical protein